MPKQLEPAPLPIALAGQDSSLPARADALIVLGGGVLRDGTLTAVSQARVRRACELYHSGAAPRLIMSGRFGAFLRKPISEAAAMAAHARACNIPDHALLIEEDARDTMGNARFTRERYLAPNAWQRVHIVTSDFHNRRAQALFRAVLGPDYECSFSLVTSGVTRAEVALRLLEPLKMALFLARRTMIRDPRSPILSPARPAGPHRSQSSVSGA